VEISSVNRKQLEIRAGLPKEITSYEPLLRNIISEKISRGYISVSVNLELNHAALQKTMKVNEAFVSAIVKKCRHLQEHLDLPGQIELRDIINIPGVIDTGTQDFNMPALQSTFTKALTGAVSELIKMRAEEGKRLRADILKRFAILNELIDNIEPIAAHLPHRQKERLFQKLKEADLAVSTDDERILRELVIFADRADVSEEITRLRSHIKQFYGFLETDDKPVGRSLDFVIQEISREITTLGNKAADQEISPFVVIFKTELEKIREQAQNIE
jgi:uncharacterized protein (TIGR00255 family)